MLNKDELWELYMQTDDRGRYTIEYTARYLAENFKNPNPKEADGDNIE